MPVTASFECDYPTALMAVRHVEAMTGFEGVREGRIVTFHQTDTSIHCTEEDVRAAILSTGVFLEPDEYEEEPKPVFADVDDPIDDRVKS